MATNSKTIGGYAVEGEIGSGGMGVVLLAQQTSLQRPVVLKKLRRELTTVREIVERFQREARAAARVIHPNVVAVYDGFKVRNELYIVQEYVDGVDLRTALDRVKYIPPRIAALILLEVSRGLESVHERGTVHRDVKPANLLLGRSGEVKITDFGIALECTSPALTRAGVVVGTPEYMPPEQLQGERADARGDIFSLGVVLYEMLTGAPPYPDSGADDSETVLTRMLKEQYPSLRSANQRVPRYLRRIAKSCLRARTKQRPQTAAEIRRRLERKLGHPSSSDLRAEIADWLWYRGVFQQREGETVMTQHRLPTRSRMQKVRRWAIAAGITILVGTGLVFAAEKISFKEIPSYFKGDKKASAGKSKPKKSSRSKRR